MEFHQLPNEAINSIVPDLMPQKPPVEIADSPSFITGSRAYGEPKENSDIDLVVFVSDSDLQLLCECGGVSLEDAKEEYREADSASIRFGKLNLIAVANPNYFNAWKRVTDTLVKRKAVNRKPVKRDEAVTAFKQAFAEIRRVRKFFDDP